jgi:pimeloyl-ACP methyl ester carboxylesterase
VLVLHGAEDRPIPLALSRRLARAHPNVRLVTLPGVGHDEIPGVVARDDAPWAEVRRALDVAGR